MIGITQSMSFVKTIKIYQWIFSIFGLQLPPILMNHHRKSYKYFIIFCLYFLYSLLLIILVIYSAYSHNCIIYLYTSKYELDDMTKILSVIQNYTLAVVQLIIEVKTFWSQRQLKEILCLIDKLEKEIKAISQDLYKEPSIWKGLLKNSGLYIMVFSLIVIYINYFIISDIMDVRIKAFMLLASAAIQMKCLEYGIFVQLILQFIIMLKRSLKDLKFNMDLKQRR